MLPFTHGRGGDKAGRKHKCLCLGTADAAGGEEGQREHHGESCAWALTHCGAGVPKPRHCPDPQAPAAPCPQSKTANSISTCPRRGHFHISFIPSVLPNGSEAPPRGSAQRCHRCFAPSQAGPSRCQHLQQPQFRLAAAAQGEQGGLWSWPWRKAATHHSPGDGHAVSGHYQPCSLAKNTSHL